MNKWSQVIFRPFGSIIRYNTNLWPWFFFGAEYGFVLQVYKCNIIIIIIIIILAQTAEIEQDLERFFYAVERVNQTSKN